MSKGSAGLQEQGLAFLFIPDLTHPHSPWAESDDHDKLGKDPQLVQKRKAWKPD